MFGLFKSKKTEEEEEEYNINDLVIDLIYKFGIDELEKYSKDRLFALMTNGTILNIKNTDYSIYMNLYNSGSIYGFSIRKGIKKLSGDNGLGLDILKYIESYYTEKEESEKRLFQKELELIVIEDRKKYLSSDIGKEFAPLFDELRELETITKRANEILASHQKAKANLIG